MNGKMENPFQNGPGMCLSRRHDRNCWKISTAKRVEAITKRMVVRGRSPARFNISEIGILACFLGLIADALGC